MRVDLGAGRVLTFKKLGRRKSVPAAIAGRYVSADTGATWEIRRSGEDWAASVGGPLIAGGAAWPVRGIDADTVEIESPGSWITVSQLAHLVRDRAGRVVALEVSTGRIKKMRFDRQLSSRAKRGILRRRRERSLAALADDNVARLSETESRTSGRRWSIAHSGRARA